VRLATARFSRANAGRYGRSAQPVRNVRCFPTPPGPRLFPSGAGSSYVPAMPKTPTDLPEAVQTVGGMLRAGVLVRSRCASCSNVFDVDLPTLAQVKGRDFSLIDKEGQCRISACRGPLTFLFALSASDKLRPLVSGSSVEPPEPPRPRPPAVPKARPGAIWADPFRDRRATA
jgi:hypothetical protein